MLGVAPKAKAPAKVEADPLAEATPEPTGPTSSTVLKVDEWDLARGQSILATSAPLRHGGLTPEAVADFYSAAFQTEPEFADNPADARRADFLRTLTGTSEYQALRVDTTLDDVASNIAARSFGEQFIKLTQEDKRAGKDKGKDSPKAKEARAVKAAAAALDKAEEEVGELEDTRHALGMGEGVKGDPLKAGEVASLFEKIKNSPRLRRIVELAGRFRRMAQSKQRLKVGHGFDDVVGVETGGDVSRLLPSELAALGDEDLELDALRRICENQAMLRAYRGSEKVGKGPVVVCVDESGSMAGEPVANAKAFALAMAWIARHQNRPIVLIGYSGGEAGTILPLWPNRWDEGALIGWLEHFYGMGSYRDVPIYELPRWWPGLKMPQGKTDVIFITDAICSLGGEMVATFNAWKKAEKVRAITLVINSPPGDMEQVSDEVHRVKSVGTEEEAIERCLSI
jgi:uncharacterized protein with von Willebrand factor type A (vWA) domain